MLKLGIIVVIVSILIGVALYARFFVFNKSFAPAPSQGTLQTDGPKEVPVEAPTSKTTKASPSPTATTSNSSSQTSVPTITSASTETRIRNLEQTITVLQNRVNQLTSPAPNTLSAGKQPAIYIPLGSGGSLGDKGFNNYQGFLVSLNPADFPGYTSMQLEVSFRVVDGTGTGTVRLLNSTDNSGISSSQVSTGSNSFVLQSSSGFTLDGGAKTYQLQGQSTNGYQLYIQNARIRVNF